MCHQHDTMARNFYTICLRTAMTTATGVHIFSGLSLSPNALSRVTP